MERPTIPEVKEFLRNLPDKSVAEFKDLAHNNFRNLNDEDFRDALWLSSLAGLELGVRNKWWEDWDETGPIPFMKKFKLEDFPEGATTANLAVALDIFPSITQARKNNVNAPLTKGVHSFKKGKIRALIE